MYESLGLELDPRAASVIFGLGLGALFGVLAQLTRFCLRRAVAGDADERAPARGVWLTALLVALIGTQGAVAAGWVDFSAHRFTSASLPVLAIVAGGLMFGAGMVLTRGCISRLTVLTASGNLRALTVLMIVAVTAHATLKGVLSPLRTNLGALTVDLGAAPTLAGLPGGAPFWTALLVLAAAAGIWRSGARPLALLGGAVIGLLAVAGWVGTGFVLYDDFDPIALESLSFTSPWTEALFFTIASTAIPAGFGAALIGGVLLGAFASSVSTGAFQWQSFESPAQTGRYVGGAVLMGLGGVPAGGCTIGAGLSGIPTLSIAAILALLAIVAGGWATDRALRGAGSRTGAAIPAE